MIMVISLPIIFRAKLPLKYVHKISPTCTVRRLTVIKDNAEGLGRVFGWSFCGFCFYNANDHSLGRLDTIEQTLMGSGQQLYYSYFRLFYTNAFRQLECFSAVSCSFAQPGGNY